MYSLRKITGDSTELNFYLGDSYTLVYKRLSPEEFKKAEDHHLTVDKEKCFGIIFYNDGKESVPLFDTQENYIMIENRIYDKLD